jgi:putative peptidoglycan lipid II flippase
MPTVKRGIKKIRTILSQEQTQILETAFWLMLPALLTKIFGQLFQLILSSIYGIEDSRINQFYIANAIPELLTTVLMVGAVGAVIIPVLVTSKSKEGDERFYRVYSSILNLTVLVFAAISALIVIFAGDFIPLALRIADAQLTSQAELDNIANMMRAMILPQLLLGVSVFMSSGLNIYNRYLIPQLSPLFFNLGRIGAVLVLIPLVNKSPWAIVASVYIGSFLHILVQIPLYLKLKIKYYFIIDFRDPYLKEIWKLGLPRFMVLASDQIGLAVNSFIAAAFNGGPFSLNLAKSIYLVIPSVFGYTFSNASFPTLSRLYIEQNYDKIRYIVHKTLNEIFFMAVPFVVTLMILRVPIVRLIFGLIPGTNLDLIGSYQIAWILLFFSFGLVFITARWFMFSLFYAAKDTLLPSVVSVVSLVSVIGLSILFTNFLSHNPNFAISTIDWNFDNFFSRAEPPNRAGIGGISLAMSVVYSIEFIILLLIFNGAKFKLNLKKLIKNLSKKLIAGAIMAIFMYFTYRLWTAISYSSPEASISEGFTGSTTLNILIMTIVTTIPGFLIYYLICLLFNVEELKILKKYLNPIFRIGGLSIKEEQLTTVAPQETGVN